MTEASHSSEQQPIAEPEARTGKMIAAAWPDPCAVNGHPRPLGGNMPERHILSVDVTSGCYTISGPPTSSLEIAKLVVCLRDAGVDVVADTDSLGVVDHDEVDLYPGEARPSKSLRADPEFLMHDQHLRLECLKIAVASVDPEDGTRPATEHLVAQAELLSRFVIGTTNE